MFVSDEEVAGVVYILACGDRVEDVMLEEGGEDQGGIDRRSRGEGNLGEFLRGALLDHVDCFGDRLHHEDSFYEIVAGVCLDDVRVEGSYPLSELEP